MGLMQILDGDAVQLLADDVLLVAAGFSGLIFEPYASLLRELGSKIERSGRHLRRVGGLILGELVREQVMGAHAGGGFDGEVMPLMDGGSSKPLRNQALGDPDLSGELLLATGDVDGPFNGEFLHPRTLVPLMSRVNSGAVGVS